MNKEQLLKCPLCGSSKPEKVEAVAKPVDKGVYAVARSSYLLVSSLWFFCYLRSLAEAYAYVPGMVEEKKVVDPDDPFGEVELVEWGHKKKFKW